MDLFLGFLFVSLVYMSVFMPVLSCFDYCSFVIYFEIRKYGCLQLVLAQDCFGLLWFHVNLRIAFSVKNAIGIMTGIALALKIILGSMYILAIFF